MNALVTGAGGFIGRHLVDRLLRDGAAVRVLVRDGGRRGDWPSSVEVAVGDVRDTHAMKIAAAGVEAVFHLASNVHSMTEVVEDHMAHHSVNVEGTLNVLERAVAGGASRFVFFSSVSTMGSDETGPLDESAVTRPVGAYGRSKLEAEQLVQALGRSAGLHVVCLRLPLVYGPGNKGNLLKMIVAIDRGLFPPLLDLGNRRSMVHVVDAVQAAVLAAEIPAANGQCYIVTDGRAYSTRELYEMICHGLGRRIPQWYVPIGILRVMGYMGDAASRIRRRRFVFDSDALEKLIGSAWYSSDKLSRELGYRPATTFPEALPELIAWYRKVQA